MLLAFTDLEGKKLTILFQVIFSLCRKLAICFRCDLHCNITLTLDESDKIILPEMSITEIGKEIYDA